MGISLSHPLFLQLHAGLQKTFDLLLLALSIKDGLWSKVEPSCINIGGGPHFYKKGWMNLEEVESMLNPHPFKLGVDCRFPIADESMHTVYSSHCLEHLNTATVQRVLCEAGRVLAGKGRLVIKLPDYEDILQHWNQGDMKYFDENWALDSATWTWNNRGVKESLDFKAAMIFCGFWNQDYGNPYTGKIGRNGSAYHGPPMMDEKLLRSLLESNTPHRISMTLRQIVIDNETGFTFNHQNAWSRDEFKELLEGAGFRVISDDPGVVTTTNKDIPGINKMGGISMYFQAERR